MRKLTLLSAVLAGMLLVSNATWAQNYKFTSKPKAAIQSAQTVIDHIWVPTNVQITDVRVALFAKAIRYANLDIYLTSPTGTPVQVYAASNNNWHGSFGSERSYTIFQDGGNAGTAPTTQPNDRPLAPASSFAILNGEYSMGWWTLSVTDNAALFSPAQTGSLEAWSLMFNSVILEPEVVLWQLTLSPAQLKGRINGVLQIVPNKKGGLQSCINPASDPTVTVGDWGDAYAFDINNTGYPGMKIGDIVSGFTTPGRFRVFVDIAPFDGAFTGDIGVYFGRVPTFTPPLPDPPFPANTTGTSIGGWPKGSGGVTNILQGPSPIFGGVRLSACNDLDGWPSSLYNSQTENYSCMFDDMALSGIEAATLPPGLNTYGGPPNFNPPSFKPEQQLASLNGNDLEGLYYVTVYDTYGENNVSNFGQIKIFQITVQYLAGGGLSPNQMMHQGIAGPLMGVPVPGPITGAALGFLPDVVSTIPPFSMHAKDQDPILGIWATQKIGPRAAVGYERIQFVNTSNYIPPAGVSYTGPWAYPPSLDADPTKAGALVNADVFYSVPVGDYKMRLALVQNRYDDDLSDNEYESSMINVNPITQAFYGTRIPSFNGYQAGDQYGLVTLQNLSVNNSYGVAFPVFKNPTSKISSIDFKFDRNTSFYLGANPRAACRVSLWKTSNGLAGAPVGPPVARSLTINADEYQTGTWRTFPLYTCDNQGNITNTASVDLTQGTYVAMLENVDQNSGLIGVWPYSYGALPFLTDRYSDFNFTGNYGPLGPFSVLGTRFGYTGSNNANPPTAWIGGFWGNFTLPMRMNFTDLNDFAVDYVTINGLKGTEAVSLTNAPFKPNVNVTAAALQGGNKKDFNIRLEIFNGQNTRVYLDDVMYGPSNGYPGIGGFETVSIPMAEWNPSVGGIYHVIAHFSRNPDDQNPVNDVHEYDLFVSTTRAILATGAGASQNEINEAMNALNAKGIEVSLMNCTDTRIASARSTNIYVVGEVTAEGKANLAAAVNNGSDLAFVYNRHASIGNLLKSVDHVFDIDRGRSVDYANIDLTTGLKSIDQSASTAPVLTGNVHVATKEDLAALLAANTVDVESLPVQKNNSKVSTDNLLPVVVSSPYGEITTITEEFENIGILYTIPTSRKAAPVTVEAASPIAFNLNQNYPNPFNPSTMISYSLPEVSVVTLRIFDMLGREVRTLVNSTQQAGTFSMTWNGLDVTGNQVSSGSYMYRLDATPANGGQTFTSMKKMTFAK